MIQYTILTMFLAASSVQIFSEQCFIHDIQSENSTYLDFIPEKCTELILYDDNIKDEGAIAIAAALKKNETLEVLTLGIWVRIKKII